MSKKYIIGVIGAGRIGKIHIENLLSKVKGVKLKAVADINIDERLTQWASEIGIFNLIDDPNEIFTDSEIDAIIIASSTDTHTKYIQEAALAKKHVFCEKPIDTNLKRIKETLAIVKRTGIKLMIGFNRRFDRNFKKVHETVVSGQIGVPHVIKITSRDPSPPPIEYIKTSGGLFVDMTIHDWDMARFLAGSEVDEIYANGAVLIDPEIGKAGDIDTAVAILKFKNGTLGIVDNSRKAIYGYDQRIEVLGSNGCVLADNESTNTVRIYTSDCINTDKIPYFFLERYMGSYASELQYFFNCLRNETQPLPNGEDGLKNVLVAIAAQKSLEEHRPVKMSEVNKNLN